MLRKLVLVAVAVGGVNVAACGPPARVPRPEARELERVTRYEYKGREIVVRSGEGGPQLTIDGVAMEIEEQSGRYSSREFFIYFRTPLELAQALIDHGLAGRTPG